MRPKLRIALAVVVAVTLFWGGYAVGQNKFGTPTTIIHVVTIKWKPEAPEAEKQKALEGVKRMAAEIPGIKNVWIKATRVQPRDFADAFAIEFEDRAAADRYAEHAAHETWAKQYLAIREASRSLQVTN